MNQSLYSTYTYTYLCVWIWYEEIKGLLLLKYWEITWNDIKNIGSINNWLYRSPKQNFRISKFILFDKCGKLKL